MTTTHNKTIKTNMSENCNKDITKEYKIFMIINTSNNKFYITQTTNKYLSTTISDMKRRPSTLTKELFYNDTYELTLLETMKTDNLYFVKNKVNELIKKQTNLTQAKDGRGSKKTNEEKSECEECNSTEEDSDEEEEKPKAKPKPKPKTSEPIKDEEDPKKYYCKYCDKYELKANKKRHETTPKIKNLMEIEKLKQK
jgi:hypothetical protein